MESQMPDYEKNVYLYKQLSNGAYRYRSYLLTTTLIRVGLIVLIWSLIISQVIGSPIAIAFIIAALIMYAFIDKNDVEVRI